MVGAEGVNIWGFNSFLTNFILMGINDKKPASRVETGRYCNTYNEVRPPSIGYTAPLMMFASSPNRKTTRLATSLAVPYLPAGMPDSTAFFASSDP